MPASLSLSSVQSFGHIYSLKLYTYDEIELGALEALCNKRSYLNLSGLKQLPAESAQALAQHRGILQLDGVTSLNLETVQTLAARKGGLWLNGITELLPGQAEALSKHQGDLYLWGLKTLWKAEYKMLQKAGAFLTDKSIQFKEDICKFCGQHQPDMNGNCNANPEGGGHMLG